MYSQEKLPTVGFLRGINVQTSLYLFTFVFVIIGFKQRYRSVSGFLRVGMPNLLGCWPIKDGMMDTMLDVLHILLICGG